MKQYHNLLFTTILLTACATAPKESILEEFPQPEAVEVTIKNMETDSIRAPYIMECAAGKLVFANYGYPQLLTAFDSNTGQYIGDYLNTGNGPNELIHVTSLDSRGDKLIVHDSNINKVVIYSQEGLLNHDKWDSQISLQVDSATLFFPFECCLLQNGYMVVNGIIKGHRMALLDKEGRCILPFGNYPGEDESYVANAFAYQSKMEYNSDEKILAIASFNGENIAFYNLSNLQSPSLVKEYIGAAPIYNDVSDSESKSVVFKKESVVGFISLAASPQYCIGLFRGKPYEGREYGGDKLLLFDWTTGKAVKALQLDQTYTNLTYDVQNEEIILLGEDEETFDFRVVTISLKEM